jgi:hypothetical protein
MVNRIDISNVFDRSVIVAFNGSGTAAVMKDNSEPDEDTKAYRSKAIIV